jgi:hypothetical protein
MSPKAQGLRQLFQQRADHVRRVSANPIATRRGARYIPPPCRTTRTACSAKAPLANGRPVCSEACDEGWWQIVPTIDGALYADPSETSESAAADWRSGPEPVWRCLEAPPKSEEAATPEQEAYIDGQRLRQKLIELNPYHHLGVVAGEQRQWAEAVRRLRRPPQPGRHLPRAGHSGPGTAPVGRGGGLLPKGSLHLRRVRGPPHHWNHASKLSAAMAGERRPGSARGRKRGPRDWRGPSGRATPGGFARRGLIGAAARSLVR